MCQECHGLLAKVRKKLVAAAEKAVEKALTILEGRTRICLCAESCIRLPHSTPSLKGEMHEEGGEAASARLVDGLVFRLHLARAVLSNSTGNIRMEFEANISSGPPTKMGNQMSSTRPSKINHRRRGKLRPTCPYVAPLPDMSSGRLARSDTPRERLQWFPNSEVSQFNVPHAQETQVSKVITFRGHD